MDDLNGFKPPPYLRNPHLQTLLNSQGPRKLRARHILKHLISKTLTLQAEDGTRLLAELDHAAAQRYAPLLLTKRRDASSR